MSCGPVRAAFRAAWPSFCPALPYVDAINTLPETLPPRFGSLAFETTGRRPVTMGSAPWFTEEGQAVVSLFGPSGEGDAPLIAEAEAVLAALQALDLGPDLRITGLVGPNDSSGEDEGAFFEVQVAVAYEFQGRQAAA
jgi:hypothetical protein